MQERDFLKVCDTVFARLKQGALSDSSYYEYLAQSELSEDLLQRVCSYMQSRNHLIEYGQFGQLNDDAILFALSNTYISEYDKKYHITFEEDTIRTNSVEEIPKVKSYRSIVIYSTIIAIVVTIVLWLLSKQSKP